MKLHLAALAAVTLSACTTATQQEMRAANDSIEATWRAARAGRWQAARVQAAQVPVHVRAGVQAKPVRKVAGADVDLRPILAGWEKNHTLAATGSTAKYDAAIRATLAQCTACHSAIGKPETKIFQPPQL